MNHMTGIQLSSDVGFHEQLLSQIAISCLKIRQYC